MTGRVLLLGGYGLIGSEILRALLAEGRPVRAVARSALRGRRLFPEADWLGLDIAAMRAPGDWAEALTGVEAVVNAAGALQSGGRDDVAALQSVAIKALIAAAEDAGAPRFVQISAPGAELDAATEFMRTKAEADDALRASRLPYVILRPGLVIAPTAYGATTLLRALAAVPYAQPILHAEAPVQCVGGADVAAAARRALRDDALLGHSFDLVEDAPRSLLDTVLAFRRWLGADAPVAILRAPAWTGRLAAAAADLSGRLGWRSALRSAALSVLRGGVVGDPGPWRAATGGGFASLEETLAALPSTRQERLFARARLLFAPLTLLFAAFWIASGAIGLARLDAAAALVEDALGPAGARASVVLGAALDIAIGLALLTRRGFAPACLAAIALCLGYLVAGTIARPDLWGDPLGPLVKIFPAIGVALALLAISEER